MKKHEIITLVLVILVVAGIFWYFFFDVSDLQAGDNQALTEIRIAGDSLDLGRMKYHDRREITFTIANTGDHPLLIKDVQPSCGCTRAEWNKRPVQPGDSTAVSLLFEPNSLGRFMKSIEVVCNTPQRLHILKIRGEVEE